MKTELSREDERPALVHEARAMIEREILRFRSDPDAPFEEEPKWKRHAVNAVLDLQKAEAELAEARKALAYADVALELSGWSKDQPCRAAINAAMKEKK